MKKKSELIVGGLAHLFSVVFSPLLSATYGIAIAVMTTYLRALSTKIELALVGITLFVTAMIPATAIYWLWRRGAIADPALNDRKGRTIPFIITALCYIALSVYLYLINAPSWLWSFPAGGAIAIGICTVINRWWKISGHMAGMGGIVAVAFRITLTHATLVDMHVWLSVLVILAGIVGTSRIILHRHTLLQVLAGFAVGYCAVFFMSMV